MSANAIRIVVWSTGGVGSIAVDACACRDAAGLRCVRRERGDGGHRDARRERDSVCCGGARRAAQLT